MSNASHLNTHFGDTLQPNDQNVRRIRELNDALRRTRIGGQILITTGIQALGHERLARILERIAAFDAFSSDNDPYGEHDFGAFADGGETVFWKIDYFDCRLEAASPDPADPHVTRRVLTIMRADEY